MNVLDSVEPDGCRIAIPGAKIQCAVLKKTGDNYTVDVWHEAPVFSPYHAYAGNNESEATKRYYDIMQVMSGGK